MERQIFRHGEPSPYFLHGGPLRGIPQGCPFAVIFANLFATYWILCCTMAGVTLLAYLDDWLVICNTWADMAHAWGTTAEVCKVIGSSVNVKKTCCAVAFDPHNHPPGRPHSLRKVKLVKTFRYLGADISLSGTALRPTAAKRCASFIYSTVCSHSICAFFATRHFACRRKCCTLDGCWVSVLSVTTAPYEHHWCDRAVLKPSYAGYPLWQP